MEADMSGTKNHEDALFDDLAAEEARLAEEEQAEFDAALEAEESEPEDLDADARADQLFEIIDKLKSENESLNDKMLRTVAEMENLRRRTQREVADARMYSASNFARDMLGVGDNLRRALESLPEGARDNAESGMKVLVEGVEMTEREMLNALEKNGVKKLNPENEKFDPNFHQAMFEVPNPDVPNNTVVTVVQEGYQIGDRVLRPAMVGVAKGGPKAAPTPTAEDEAESGEQA